MNISYEKGRCGIGADLAAEGGYLGGPDEYREPRMSGNAVSALFVITMAQWI
jgi:hypothetical protein